MADLRLLQKSTKRLNGNSNPENARFKLEIAEWRGYTLRALEDINEELKEIKGDIRVVNQKVDKLSAKITNVQIRVAGIGAVIALITSFAVQYFIYG